MVVATGPAVKHSYGFEFGNLGKVVKKTGALEGAPLRMKR